MSAQSSNILDLMPCPFFEPQQVAIDPQHPRARLPLFEEYDGICHAAPEPFRAPAEVRFRYCNHGYSRGGCASFPDVETRCCARFDVLRSDVEAIELLCVEERGYAPLR